MKHSLITQVALETCDVEISTLSTKTCHHASTGSDALQIRATINQIDAHLSNGMPQFSHSKFQDSRKHPWTCTPPGEMCRSDGGLQRFHRVVHNISVKERGGSPSGKRGVGICIARKLLDKINGVLFFFYSDKVCALHFTLGTIRFQTFSCYMPTSGEPDFEIEQLLELLGLLEGDDVE